MFNACNCTTFPLTRQETRQFTIYILIQGKDKKCKQFPNWPWPLPSPSKCKLMEIIVFPQTLSYSLRTLRNHPWIDRIGLVWTCHLSLEEKHCTDNWWVKASYEETELPCTLSTVQSPLEVRSNWFTWVIIVKDIVIKIFNGTNFGALVNNKLHKIKQDKKLSEKAVPRRIIGHLLIQSLTDKMDMWGAIAF